MGVLLEQSVKNNLVLGYHREKNICQRGIFNRKALVSFAQNCIEKYNIKTSGLEQPIRYLSGGNQQKVVLARNFSQELQVLIAAHPTRGVDVGAIEFIHKQILDFRDRGKGVLLVSADLDEVRALSDRILVLYEGKIVYECRPEDVTAVQMGLMMTGMSPSEALNLNARKDQ